MESAFYIVPALIIVVFFLASAVRILREYERGVIFRLGRLIAAKGPGLILLIPVLDRMVKVSLRTLAMEVPAQDVITRDNVSVKVSAVIFFRVLDPRNAVVQVQNFCSRPPRWRRRQRCGACSAQVGRGELLASRDKINQQLPRSTGGADGGQVSREAEEDGAPGAGIRGEGGHRRRV
jgi:regulator of protease activity HflC (stomatin/prohibitin superfamily)